MSTTVQQLQVDGSRNGAIKPLGARSWQELFVASACIAVVVALLQYFPDRDDGSGSVLAGLSALVAAALGLTAAAKARPLRQRSTPERVRLLTMALGVGLGVGIANLGVNYGMSMLDPVIRQQMITRWAEFSTWSVVFSEPIMEEIVYRLLLLSVVAWIVSRFTTNARTIAIVALSISALVFGVAHVFYGGVDAPLYAIGMAAKSSAGGLAFGLVFWRWGLPYAIACHCMANAVHLLLMPALF